MGLWKTVFGGVCGRQPQEVRGWLRNRFWVGLRDQGDEGVGCDHVGEVQCGIGLEGG